MELLYSSVVPVRPSGQNFKDAFLKLMVPSTDIKIATGYISEDSLMELKSLLVHYKNKKDTKTCDLVIGMHGLEGFTQNQYNAACNLAKFLNDAQLGSVHVCTAFKFHGKIYSFSKGSKPQASILGSSNLSGLLGLDMQWEADVLLTESEKVNKLLSLHRDIVNRATKSILDYEPRIITNTSGMLDGVIGVERPSHAELESVHARATKLSFEIPLKAEAKSNLNVYFGKGRETKATGLVRPRPWYEVELIVPRPIAMANGYPDEQKPFTVYTNDGWKFRCKVSGQNKKNLRSEDDLQTLGRWIKGHLESEGILKVGEPVTQEMLRKYGTENLLLTATDDPNIWLLDFSRKY